MPGLAMVLNGANENQGLGASCPTCPCSAPLFPQVSDFLGKVPHCFGNEGVDFSNHRQHKPTSPSAQASIGPAQPLLAGLQPLPLH